MSAISTTGMDLIIGALRNINALEAGETPNAQDSADAQQVMNDMLESWSIDKLFIFASTENLLTFVPGQYQYTIGNPVGGTFAGVLTLGSPTIVGVTVPSNLIVGGTLTDSSGAIPAGTTIASFNSGSNVVTMSQNALFSVPSGDVVTYTVPGNFAIPRPIRITAAFTRITSNGTTGLDYPIDVDVTQAKYTAIGLKGIPGPWPILCYYNQTYPLGTLYFYPNPQSAGVLHLWTDTLLSDFATLTQPINLSQGYARAIKKNLALELAPEYGKTAGALLVKQAAESIAKIKALNALPAVTAFFDRDIVRTRRNDAGWIFHGGFQ